MVVVAGQSRGGSVMVVVMVMEPAGGHGRGRSRSRMVLMWIRREDHPGGRRGGRRRAGARPGRGRDDVRGLVPVTTTTAADGRGGSKVLPVDSGRGRGSSGCGARQAQGGGCSVAGHHSRKSRTSSFLFFPSSPFFVLLGKFNCEFRSGGYLRSSGSIEEVGRRRRKSSIPSRSLVRHVLLSSNVRMHVKLG